MSGRVGALDGLRAIAIFGVVLFHLFGLSGILGNGGLDDRLIYTFLGNTIDIFFILSGFGLFLPVLRRGGELGRVSDWYIKRFGRLQPEYWACLIVLVLFLALVGWSTPVPGPGAFLLHVFDLQTPYRMLEPGFQVGFFIGGGPVWLVSVIAGLYLIFPLLCRLIRWNVYLCVLMTAAITVAWKLGPDYAMGLFQWVSGREVDDYTVRILFADQVPSYLFSFTLGMVVAIVYELANRHRGDPWVKRGVIAAFTIGLPAYLLVSIPYTDAAMSSIGIEGSTRGRGLAWNGLASTTVRGILILGLILGPLWLQRPFASRPAHWLATQSFGIYLIHVPLALLVFIYVTPPIDGSPRAMAEWVVLVVPAAILYGWCSHRFVGQPSGRAVDRWLRRRRASRPDPVAPPPG